MNASEWPTGTQLVHPDGRIGALMDLVIQDRYAWILWRHTTDPKLIDLTQTPLKPKDKNREATNKGLASVLGSIGRL